MRVQASMPKHATALAEPARLHHMCPRAPCGRRPDSYDLRGFPGEALLELRDDAGEFLSRRPSGILGEPVQGDKAFDGMLADEGHQWR